MNPSDRGWTMIFHLSIAHLTVTERSRTLWHSLAPQTRLLVALTPNAQWLTWALYGVAILWLVLMSQVPFSLLCRRMAIESTFISVALLGAVFREGGQVLWQWGWMKVTTTGLTILGSVTSKAFLSLLVLNMLTLSTPIPALLHALKLLRVPPLLVAILSSMYRYSTILVEEFQSMYRAALSRNLMGNASRQRALLGSMFGALFIRTYDRGERIHHAMLARGYQGLPPTQESYRIQWRDRMAIGITIFIALLGQAVYLF
jgi:cobalt/nickel transport system permease protein